jgi:hypothetical protein
MLTLDDVERAIAVADPELGPLICRYLEQDDPDPGYSELYPDAYSQPAAFDADGDGDDDDDSTRSPEVPPGAFTKERLESELAPRAMANKTPTERKLTRRDAFASAEASPFAPPRLRLGTILVGLYGSGAPAARAALLEVFAKGKLKWGVWKAAKAIYKLAETRRDAAMFGVLAYRFDAIGDHAPREIGIGTKIYIRRRAWRYLRLLGQASPDVYPAFAVEVLRHYGSSHHGTTWVAGHIWGHKQMRYARGPVGFSLPRDLATARAFPEAWKTSPAPLLRLLEVRDRRAARRSRAQPARRRAGVARAARPAERRRDRDVRRRAAAREPRVSPVQAAPARPPRHGARPPDL